MRIIISPAKEMDTDINSLSYESLPQFLEQAKTLLDCLCAIGYASPKVLWRCNDSIADLNYRWIQSTDLHNTLTPAILPYEGIQYQYMAPGVFEREQLAYVNERLRILSGFYGLLHPFDGVTPYRLEMQARLSAGGQRDLYASWGSRLAQQLCAESGLTLNLVSKEYSEAVLPHLPKSVRFLTCTFGEWKDGRVIEKGTICKIARGGMVRWLAEQSVADSDNLRGFDHPGYTYRKELSERSHHVFVKESAEKQKSHILLNDF